MSATYSSYTPGKRIERVNNFLAWSWIERRTARQMGGVIRADALYAHYCYWEERRHKVAPMSMNMFGRTLTAMGYPVLKGHPNGVSMRGGIVNLQG